ncbi:MAG: hypothetical protein NVS3B25_34120 [Hymenobacter sp.]
MPDLLTNPFVLVLAGALLSYLGTWLLRRKDQQQKGQADYHAMRLEIHAVRSELTQKLLEVQGSFAHVAEILKGIVENNDDFITTAETVRGHTGTLARHDGMFRDGDQRSAAEYAAWHRKHDQLQDQIFNLLRSASPGPAPATLQP